MNHKVLLADDSLTIQKVIKITLANQSYDIIDANTEEDLFQKLTEEKPSLVLLDFNLSEKFTGYELTSKIKATSPSTQVLLLLGTFDSIDDAAFEKCGAADKIVKPFDSNKFIALCRQLVEAAGEDEESFDASDAEDEISVEDTSSYDEGQWQMNHSTEHKLDPLPGENKLDGSIPNLNPLQSEISDWGMSVPGVIGTEDSEPMELPPVIGEEKAAADARPKLPSAADLDYPELGAEEADLSDDLSSNLISIDSFRQEPEQELQMEGSYMTEESDVSQIEDLIRDEVEVDLWKADEDSTDREEQGTEQSTGFQPRAQDFDASLFKPLDDQDSISWTESDSRPETDVSKFLRSSQEEKTTASVDGAQLEALVRKCVQEYMDEMFKNKVEKVAWEVIPDLAENLIRQELSKISDRILKETK